MLIGLIIIAASFAYRDYRQNIYLEFPINRISSEDEGVIPFYLFFYFHSHDCPQCLKVITILNNLPRHFQIKGLVPEDEIRNVAIIKEMTGAIFELASIEKYKKFIPLISPALIGVSKEGAVLFILPAIPDQEEYLLDFLESFYYNRISVGIESYMEQSGRNYR